MNRGRWASVLLKEVSDKKYIAAILEIKSPQNPLRHPELPFYQQRFPSKDILLLPHLPESKNFPEKEVFWGADPLGAPV